MALSKILEKAFEEALHLPAEKQAVVAEIILELVHEAEDDEAEWDALVQSPESQRFLDKMARKVRKERARGEWLESAPGDQ